MIAHVGETKLRRLSGVFGTVTPDITEHPGDKRLKQWRADRDEAIGTAAPW